MSRKLNVYLCGDKVGVLSENELLQLSFHYDNDKVAPLSVHLPVRDEEYPHALAFPFFENLTPEGDAFDILTRDHVAGNKTFSILNRLGGDCAGAVAFYETAPDHTKGEPLIEISPATIAYIIDELPNDPLLTSLENPPRLSLAGAQSKFAVHQANGKYYRSDDQHPTTHIIKIINKRFPDLLKNELFCMKLAEEMQMDVPNVELKETEGRPYLEIERYDRHREKGTVRRIHQEDFCQALGFVSDKKYQTDGGASLRDCHQVIGEFSETKLRDIRRFVEWIVFNYLIGNTDAHAKNLSLLHAKTGLRLAPFYDLLSTEVYPARLVDHKMAMLINGKGRYDSLKPVDFVSLFGQLGLNATNMMKSVKDKFSPIISTAEALCDKLRIDEKTATSPLIHDIIAMMRKRHATLFNGELVR